MFLQGVLQVSQRSYSFPKSLYFGNFGSRSTLNQSIDRSINQSIHVILQGFNSSETDNPVALGIPDRIEIWKCWFLWRKENWTTWRKILRVRTRTNNKLNPHMTPGPGIEPGSHWWEMSALTTAPFLLPYDSSISHYPIDDLGNWCLTV